MAINMESRIMKFTRLLTLMAIALSVVLGLASAYHLNPIRISSPGKSVISRSSLKAMRWSFDSIQPRASKKRLTSVDCNKLLNRPLDSKGKVLVYLIQRLQNLKLGSNQSDVDRIGRVEELANKISGSVEIEVDKTNSFLKTALLKDTIAELGSEAPLAFNEGPWEQCTDSDIQSVFNMTTHRDRLRALNSLWLELDRHVASSSLVPTSNQWRTRFSRFEDEGAHYGMILSLANQEKDPMINPVPVPFQRLNVTVVQWADNNHGIYVDHGGVANGFIPIDELLVLPGVTVEMLKEMYPPDSIVEVEAIGKKGMQTRSMQSVCYYFSVRRINRLRIINRLHAAIASKEIVNVTVSSLFKFGAVCSCMGEPCFIPANLLLPGTEQTIVGSIIKARVLSFQPGRGTFVCSHVSEREATNPTNILRVGSMVYGKVNYCGAIGVFVSLLGGYQGLIHNSEISQEPLNFKNSSQISAAFSSGMAIKAILIRMSDGKISLSTRVLERSPGEVLLNASDVFENAEETWAAYQEKYSQLNRTSSDSLSIGASNWDNSRQMARFQLPRSSYARQQQMDTTRPQVARYVPQTPDSDNVTTSSGTVVLNQPSNGGMDLKNMISLMKNTTKSSIKTDHPTNKSPPSSSSRTNFT